MLKINLLPPYLQQRKLMKVAFAVVAVVLLLEVAVVFAARQQPVQDQKALQAELQEKSSGLTQVKSLESSSQQVLTQEQAFSPKFDFFKQVMEYNESYPDLYSETARYTYREATVLNLEASGNVLRFTAYVANPADVSRLMLGLSRCSLFQGVPTITGLPGWRQVDQLRRQAKDAGLPLDSLIIGGGVAPGAASMYGAQGGAPGMADMGGMYGGMMGGMGGMDSGGGTGGGGAAFGAAPTDDQLGGMGGMDSGGGTGGGGGMGGMYGGMGGGMGSPETGGAPGGAGTGLGSLDIAQAARKPQGFVVSVTCQLRKPIQRPGGGAAAGGGMGDMGGMYGGMMGGAADMGGMGGGMGSGGTGGGGPVSADFGAAGQ